MLVNRFISQLMARDMSGLKEQPPQHSNTPTLQHFNLDLMMIMIIKIINIPIPQAAQSPTRNLSDWNASTFLDQALGAVFTVFGSSHDDYARRLVTGWNWA